MQWCDGRGHWCRPMNKTYASSTVPRSNHSDSHTLVTNTQPIDGSELSVRPRSGCGCHAFHWCCDGYALQCSLRVCGKGAPWPVYGHNRARVIGVVRLALCTRQECAHSLNSNHLFLLNVFHLWHSIAWLGSVRI